MKPFILAGLFLCAAVVAFSDKSMADGHCFGSYYSAVPYYAPHVYHAPPVYYARPVSHYGVVPHYPAYGGYYYYHRTRTTYHPHHSVYRSRYRTIHSYPW